MAGSISALKELREITEKTSTKFQGAFEKVQLNMIAPDSACKHVLKYAERPLLLLPEKALRREGSDQPRAQGREQEERSFTETYDWRHDYEAKKEAILEWTRDRNEAEEAAKTEAQVSEEAASKLTMISPPPEPIDEPTIGDNTETNTTSSKALRVLKVRLIPKRWTSTTVTQLPTRAGGPLPTSNRFDFLAEDAEPASIHTTQRPPAQTGTKKTETEQDPQRQAPKKKHLPARARCGERNTI